MDNYKSKLEAFTTYPWQEDDEIDFVRLVKQYWDGPERNASSSFWRDYIRRLVKINPVILKSQTVSDKFINDLQELIATDKGVFANRLSEALEGAYASDKVDYSKFLTFTPNDGGEYYTLHIPEGVAPPDEGDHLIIANNKLVVVNVSTPDDIAKHRGGPVAKSMRANGIAYNVNCLPEGHEWIEEGTYASDSDANIGGGIAGRIDPRIKQQGEVAVKKLKLKTRGTNELQRPIIKRA